MRSFANVLPYYNAREIAQHYFDKLLALEPFFSSQPGNLQRPFFFFPFLHVMEILLVVCVGA